MMKFMILVIYMLIPQVSAMDYYTFVIDDTKVGYYETEFKDNIHYQCAIFEMNGEGIESSFWVMLKDDKVFSYKSDDNDWVEVSQFPENSYPTSAFTILAKKLKIGESFEYNQISEGQNAVVGKARMERVGNKVSEIVDGEAGRYVLFDEKQDEIEFGWGGTAKSIKVADKKTATEGTAFAEK